MIVAYKYLNINADAIAPMQPMMSIQPAATPPMVQQTPPLIQPTPIQPVMTQQMQPIVPMQPVQPVQPLMQPQAKPMVRFFSYFLSLNKCNQLYLCSQCNLFNH